MNILNKTALGIVACVAGIAFVGYCVYFDNKRRQDPDYKKKVRERRRRNLKASASDRGNMPNRNDPKAVQRYFLQELQEGESLVLQGRLEDAVEHFANAIIVCGHPEQMLHLLSSSLAPTVFGMIIAKLQEIGTRGGSSNYAPAIPTAASMGATMMDELE